MDFTELNTLLSTLPGYSLLNDAMKTAALMGARVPDSAGRWPADPAYVMTFDNYFAALSLIPFLASQPQVTSAGSEGTSITATQFSWDSIRDFYRGLSPIYQDGGNAVLKVLPIPDPPHVVRVPMRNVGGYYGDVDTDIG